VALIAISPRDPRFRETYGTYRATFRRSAALQDIPFEIVDLPFEGRSLSGYFLRAEGRAEQRPTLIVLGDRFAEELYFWGGAPRRRGYHVLLIDQPGQGITPFDALYTRVDAEVPVRAMVDYLSSRSEVDPSRIALYGIASAGYMATRAVAFEKRISACIADTPLDDMESLMMAEAPASSHLSESERALRSTLFDLTAWQAGKTQLSELVEVFKGMKVDDVSRITCPMLCLVSTGEVAERIRQTRKIYALLSNPKKAFHLFTEEEGADAHNQVNNLSLLHAIVLDWLDEVYSAV
jgi:pimeloyl-ACP methyl ester carboxylesterase